MWKIGWHTVPSIHKVLGLLLRLTCLLYLSAVELLVLAAAIRDLARDSLRFAGVLDHALAVINAGLRIFL